MMHSLKFRDNRLVNINAVELVVGDIVSLEEGNSEFNVAFHF
jgi:magnesium-transporting ATPase (P-type)